MKKTGGTILDRQLAATAGAKIGSRTAFMKGVMGGVGNVCLAVTVGATSFSLTARAYTAIQAAFME